MVFAGGKRYVLYDGKWIVSDISDDDMKAMQEEGAADGEEFVVPLREGRNGEW